MGSVLDESVECSSVEGRSCANLGMTHGVVGVGPTWSNTVRLCMSSVEESEWSWKASEPWKQSKGGTVTPVMITGSALKFATFVVHSR